MLSMLRTNRDIRSLFIAQVISFAGDWFAYVAFVGLVQDLTDLALLVTLVYVAQALPAFFMSVVAGPAVDRFDRRRILVTVSLVQALAAAGLLLVGSRGTLWFGFLCLCTISALGAFVGARRAGRHSEPEPQPRRVEEGQPPVRFAVGSDARHRCRAAEVSSPLCSGARPPSPSTHCRSWPLPAS